MIATWRAGRRAGRRRWHGASRDEGTGTVWVLGCIALICVVAFTVVVAGGVRAARHRAHTAADLAALAAASGASRGEAAACRTAAAVAAGSGGRLTGCILRATTADVTVTVRVAARRSLPSLILVARARAGPVSAYGLERDRSRQLSPGRADPVL